MNLGDISSYHQYYTHPDHGPCCLILVRGIFKLEYYVGDFGYEHWIEISTEQITEWFGISKEDQAFILLKGTFDGER